MAKRPQGVAVDADGDVFIADKSDNVVREINAATGLISTVAGGSAIIPGLSGPTGLALDANGDLFVADSGNGVVWEITGVNGADPQANVVAGGGTDRRPDRRFRSKAELRDRSVRDRAIQSGLPYARCGGLYRQLSPR